MAEIQRNVRERGTDLSGARQGKRVARARMQAKASEVAQLISAYAVRQERFELAADMNLSGSRLAALRQMEVAETAERVLQNGRMLEFELSSYGLRAEDLTELAALIIAYRGLMTAPREAVNQRRRALHALDALFARADKLLREEIDRVMAPMQGTGDYATYQSARRVVGNKRPSGPAPEVQAPAVGLMA